MDADEHRYQNEAGLKVGWAKDYCCSSPTKSMERVQDLYSN